MTKADLIEALQNGPKNAKDWPGKKLSKKDVAVLVDELFNIASRSLKKNRRFAYPGFGVFQVKTRKARAVTLPTTEDGVEAKKMTIPSQKAVSFRPAPNLKNLLNPRRNKN